MHRHSATPGDASPRKAALAAVFATFVAAAGCGSALQLPYPANDYPSAEEGPLVRVLTAGAASTAPLRYTASEGATSSVATTMTISLDSDPYQVGWFELSADVAIETTVDAVSDGAIAFTQKITRASGDGEGLMVLASSQLERLAGSTASGAIDARGVLTRALAYKGGDTSILGALDQGVAVGAPLLPDEAVGVGAKWAVLETRWAGNTMYRNTTTYTLERLEGTVATFAISDIGVGPEQIASEDGVTMEIERLEAKGRGRITIDLANPFDRSGVLDHTITLVGSASADGDSVSFESVTKSTLETAPAP